MPFDYKRSVSEQWRDRLRWEALSPDLRAAIGEYGLYMFGLGQHRVAAIDEVKYDGGLVVLDDGSRWEIPSLDAFTAEMWSPFDKVAVIDDVMYNIEDAEHVDATEET